VIVNPLAEERPAIYQRNLCIAGNTGLSSFVLPLLPRAIWISCAICYIHIHTYNWSDNKGVGLRGKLQPILKVTDEWYDRLWVRVGTGGLGMEVQVEIQGRSPGGGLKAKPPEARCIQTICSCQTLFTQFCCRVRPPTPPYPVTPSQKTSDLRESHYQTRPGQSGCPPVAMLLLLCWY